MEQEMKVLRAEQARRLEAELMALVKQHSFILSMQPAIKNTLRNVADFNNFSQLQGALK
jgi:hypothetical protein